MKTRVFIPFLAILITLSGLRSTFAADPAVAQSVSVLDEKVTHLNAQIEDLQFRYQQLQKDLEKTQAELQEVRRAAGGVAPSDLKALDDRIQAVDAARQKDRQVIIDQVAKELAAMSGTKPGHSPAPTPGPGTSTTDASEHIVQKGETLSSISKTTGVTIADLRKANNLTSNNIMVGQKLVIPK